MRFFETLEERAVLTAVHYLGDGVWGSKGVSISEGSYYLTVTGTHKNNRIIVKDVDNHGLAIVSALRISINAGAGNDIIAIIGNDNRGNKGGAYILGGTGDDTISAGSGGDFVDAGDGYDRVTGDNAILVGGYGKDRLSGYNSVFLSGRYINNTDTDGDTNEYNLDRKKDRDIITSTGGNSKAAIGPGDTSNVTGAAWVSTELH